MQVNKCTSIKLRSDQLRVVNTHTQKTTSSSAVMMNHFNQVLREAGYTLQSVIYTFTHFQTRLSKFSFTIEFENRMDQIRFKFNSLSIARISLWLKRKKPK